MISLEYLLSAMIVILVPGTGVIYTISIALLNTRVQILYAALGCTLSIFPHLFAAIFGVAAILNSSVLVFNGLKLFGVVYLLYMAYNLYKDKGVLEFKGEDINTSNFTILKNGFLINVFNPKLSIFFLAFIPQFISPLTQEPIIDMTVLGFVFMILTLIVFVVYGLFASLIKQKVSQSKKIMKNMQKCFSAVFVLLAYKLANV